MLLLMHYIVLIPELIFGLLILITVLRSESVFKKELSGDISSGKEMNDYSARTWLFWMLFMFCVLANVIWDLIDEFRVFPFICMLADFVILGVMLKYAILKSWRKYLYSKPLDPQEKKYRFGTGPRKREYLKHEDSLPDGTLQIRCEECGAKMLIIPEQEKFLQEGAFIDNLPFKLRYVCTDCINSWKYVSMIRASQINITKLNEHE